MSKNNEDCIYTEQIKFYLHRSADGSLAIHSSDQSQFNAWCGICVSVEKIEIVMKVPTTIDMLRKVKDYFEDTRSKTRADAEQVIAKLRDKEQKYFALPKPEDDLL